MRNVIIFPTVTAVISLGSLCPTPAFAQDPDRSEAPGDRYQPIIDESEFDATIPPIDEDPDASMGSLADWDAEQQRLEQEARQEDAEDGVAGLPALQDGDPDELIADAPVNDPEIDDPLAPIETFDVEPFDESQYTEADDGAEAASLRYEYRIEGLESLNESAKSQVRPVSADDIRGQFHALSALEDGDGKAANGAMVSARMREDQQLLADIMSGQGFFDASVNGAVELPDAEGEKLTVVLQVKPGTRYNLGAILFEAGPVVPDDLVTSNFVPKTGDPIVAERILVAEANIAVRLPQEGYPFAEIGQRDILLDPETGTGDYTLPVNTGPRSSYGDIVTTGTTAFDAEHIAVLSRFERGEIYDSRMVDDLRKALVATGLLSIVSVKPEPSGEFAPDGPESVSARRRTDRQRGCGNTGAGRVADLSAQQRRQARPDRRVGNCGPAQRFRGL
jgi:translocation and assembly module TamA